MKRQLLAVILGGVTAFSLISCADKASVSQTMNANVSATKVAATSLEAANVDPSDVTVDSAPNAKTFERKIIKTANVTLESTVPEETQNKISALVESKKGYIVKTDTRERNVGEGSQKTVSMTLRVPSESFEETLREMKKQGVDRVVSETISGEDVTEQFVDTEARLKAKKAVEAQYLEVLKQARNVADTLEVQEKLGEVRSEIETTEGRLRLLQNQTAFSTINIEIQPTAVLGGNVRGFGYEIRTAFSDGLNGAGTIFLVFLRIIIALVPLILIFGLPAFYLIRWLKHRRAKLSSAAEIK